MDKNINKEVQERLLDHAQKIQKHEQALLDMKNRATKALNFLCEMAEENVFHHRQHGSVDRARKDVETWMNKDE